MSLFGSSPPEEAAADVLPSNFTDSRASLFEDEPPMTKSTTSALFADDDSSPSTPWDLPTPRKQQSRGDLIRSLLPPSDVPDAYIETFDAVLSEAGDGSRVTSGGVARTLAAAKLGADEQARIMGILAPAGGGDITLGRNEFNVLLALIGLAQEGEGVTLDGVDERRRSKSTCNCSLYLICPISSLNLRRNSSLGGSSSAASGANLVVSPTPRSPSA